MPQRCAKENPGIEAPPSDLGRLDEKGCLEIAGRKILKRSLIRWTKEGRIARTPIRWRDPSRGQEC